MSSLNQIQIDAVDALRKYQRAPEGARTDHLRTVATCFVDVRQHFYTPQGEPDWKGRTHAYRRWVRETMEQASIPGEKLASLQASIRYHVNNIVRERLDDESLESLGLRKESAREWSAEKRERHTEILTIFGNGGLEITDPNEIIVAARMMEAALARISLDDVANMSSKARQAVREALEAVAERVDRLVAVADAGRK